jgi:peptide/nickel transport system substrate-binding protein
MKRAIWLVSSLVLLSIIPTMVGMAGDPVYGGELVIAKPTEPQFLDPQRDSGGPSAEVAVNVLECLLRFSDEMELEPNLATSWEVSPDGLAYTFQIREGVKFHDGTDLDAEVVKFVFDRSIGAIDGKQSRYYSEIRALESVDVLGEFTVRLNLSEPYAPFINTMAHSGFAIFSPQALESMGEADFGRAPVGTGPFKVVEWTSSQQIVLEKFDGYWREGLPYLDRVVYRFLPDAQTRVAALMAGDVDFVILLQENLFKGVEAAPGLDAVMTQTLRTIFFQFGLTNEPFNDLRVRKAFTRSIDVYTIADTILEGMHTPVSQPTAPPAIGGIADEGIPPYEYDLERAAEYLEMAGYTREGDGFWMKDGSPLGFTLMVTSNRYPQDSVIGVAVKNMLREQGWDVEVGTMEWGAYRDAIFNREHQIYLFGSGCATGDIDYVTSGLFHEVTKYAQGPCVAEDLMAQAVTEPDPEKRMELNTLYYNIIREEALWFPIYWMSQFTGLSESVKGFVPRPDEKFYFDRVWLEL